MAELKHQVESRAEETTLSCLQGKLLRKKENETDFAHVWHSLNISRVISINCKRKIPLNPSIATEILSQKE